MKNINSVLAKPFAYAIALFFTISLFVFCKSETSKTDELETQKAKSQTLSAEQLNLMHIEIGKAEQRQLQGSITAMGKVTILANDMADISAQFRGRVERIRVHEGQFVKKGEVIMELTSPDIIGLQREYLVAQGELFYLEKELERQQILAKEQVGAAKSLQEVQSKVMLQKAIQKTAAASLRLAGIAPPQYDGEIVDKITIFAPLSGYVDHFPVAIGTAVTEGQKLVHIESFDDPHVDVAIYESDLQKIRTGQTVNIKFNDPSVPNAVGKVEFIGRDIDATTKTATLHVPFKMPNGKIAATDMTVTAIIETATVSSLALPESAVVQEDGKFFYFLVENAVEKAFSFKKIAFSPVGSSNGFIGVGSELAEKSVVLRGANVLLGESKKE